ncbi:MAG: hypothetical protein JSW38_05010 [Dehalococcoidia bacterium]|nr:MAG: hypothetical protein JSW38_05010 [Dehalococcoidia bacterium]
MRRDNRSLPKWLVQIVILTQALGVPALVVLAILDLEGWRAFVWSVLVSFVVQAIIALILFVVLRAVLRVFKDLLRFVLPDLLLLSIAAVLALPFLSLVFHRPVDIYDVVQTIPLIVDLPLLIGRFERFVNRIRMRQARPGQRSPFYGDLVHRVGGDRSVADRLIEYERKRAPHVSRDELVKRAIERLERDKW